MKLSRVRPRFSLRWLMVFVATVAAVMSLMARRASMLKQRDKWEVYISAHLFSTGSSGPRYFDEENVNKARTLVEKYDRAACYPWLLVEPDPIISDSKYIEYLNLRNQ